VVGRHSDYVRCLTHARHQKWIASGGFDRTIKLWDLSNKRQEPTLTLSPPETTNAKASIYALATDAAGTFVASGGPERVVRTWDPRSGKRTGKLVGHTDNIRSILISDDGRYVREAVV
jgi:WD repeat-containing protein 48